MYFKSNTSACRATPVNILLPTSAVSRGSVRQCQSDKSAAECVLLRAHTHCLHRHGALLTVPLAVHQRFDASDTVASGSIHADTHAQRSDNGHRRNCARTASDNDHTEYQLEVAATTRTHSRTHSHTHSHTHNHTSSKHRSTACRHLRATT